VVSFLNEEMTKTQGFLEFPVVSSWVGGVRKPKRVENSWGVGEEQRDLAHTSTTFSTARYSLDSSRFNCFL